MPEEFKNTTLSIVMQSRLVNLLNSLSIPDSEDEGSTNISQILNLVLKHQESQLSKKTEGHIS